MRMRIAAIAFAIIGLSASPSLAQNRHAFVVGNDAYQNIEPLKKAINDARAIAQTLQGLGFKVTLGENLTRRDFNAKFAVFEQAVQPGDTTFVFYSGHGIELDGANYLIPADAPKVNAQQQSLLKDESISSDGMIQRLRERGALLQVVVLDACRENPFRDKTGRALGPTGSSLGPPKAVRGLFVMYSAGNGQVALDRLSDSDPNPNSVFTRSLLPRLGDPNKSLRGIAIDTRTEVSRLAGTIGSDQFPGYYDQTDGEIFLSKNSPGAVAIAPQPERPLPPPPVALPPALPPVASLPPAPPVGAKGITPAPSGNDGFIFINSDRVRLTNEDLRGMSQQQLRIARNEIYARRGRFFRDPQLAAYFSRFAWYKPHSWDVSLNATESANVKLISSMER